MDTKINFIWKKFYELSLDDLYAILNLRQQVFVVEQDCPYIDADYFDQDAFHLLGYRKVSGRDRLVAYLRAYERFFNDGSAFCSLGRVVVEERDRSKDLGRIITRMGVEFLKEKYPRYEVVISAQHRLKQFYSDLGFSSRGKVYLEDDIDHIEMYI